MSFGQKPNAWSRQPAAQGQQLNPNLFTNQLQMAQFPGQVPAMSLAPGINALVNQAAFNSNLNMIAQARQLIPQNVQQQRPTSPPNAAKQPNQRTFMGTVTKLMDTYGFIDEDVFFQTSVIRGAIPRVGDRVMVEATFNPSMPFKWNAFRIQVINEQQQQQQQPVAQPHPVSVGREHPHPGNRWGSADRGVREDHRAVQPDRRAQPRRPSPQRRERSPARRSPGRVRSPQRKASPSRRHELTSKRERERTPPRGSREPRARSPVPAKSREADSPPRRRQRIIPRYQCYTPRPFVGDYGELHKRYPTLYIPSDFVRCEMTWPSSFNLEEPITFTPTGLDYHIVDKNVDIPLAEGESLPSEHPADADSKFVVKVLLLSHPGAAAIRQMVTGLLADGSIDEALEVQPLTKVLQFLVGVRGKSEVMGIGGAWSPSLDGPNPLDPQTLIRTAVRTTRATTGVDLSKCPVWYKMAQLRYFRAERSRTDTVVVMLPDVSGTAELLPSAEEYKKLVEEVLPAQLQSKLGAIDAEPFVPSAELLKEVAPVKEEEAEQKAPVVDAAPAETPAEPAADSQTAVKEAPKESAGADASELEKNGENGVENDEEDEETAENTRQHWSQLNVKGMKVADLREQLDSRGLDCRGVKNALAQRLQEALEAEKKAEEEGVPAKEDLIMTDEVADEKEAEQAFADEKMDTSEPEKPAEEPTLPEPEKPKPEDHPAYKKAVEAFEKHQKERKQTLERHYVFPKEPCVFIYPSKTAKAGKFNCRVSSLQSLLDYRVDDNKEASFEVFLFAESFREALDRSNAFTVFHTLNSVLDKESERKKRDEALTKVEEVKQEEPESAAGNPAEKPEGETEAEDKEKDEKKEEKPKESKEVADPRANFKALVSDGDTFQAFAHFDQNICGYLQDRDLEEVLYSIGLNLSRGVAQRLIKKVSSRDRFNYRNVTDKWVDKEGIVKYVPGPAEDAPSRADLFKEYEEEKPKASGAANASTDTPDVTQSGVVFYKGAVLNVTHTLGQQKKTEAELKEALLKAEQLESQLKTTKDQRDRYDKRRKHLEEDLEKYKKRLYEAEKCLKNTQDDTVLMKTSLVDVKKLGERLVSIVDKVMPPPPKKEKKEERKEGSEPAEKSSPAKQAEARESPKEADVSEGAAAEAEQKTEPKQEQPPESGDAAPEAEVAQPAQAS